MKAVILVAGVARRLAPISDTTHKALLEVGGRSLLDRMLDALAACAASASGQPSTNQLARYRARPFTQTTDVRFVDTGNFAAKSDDIFGLEFGGIFKSLHVAAEGQYLRLECLRSWRHARHVERIQSNLFPGEPSTALVPDGDPSFWGGYFEAGYFLTGETRGYKNGTWDRTKVLKPFSKGGWGAVQLNGRVDYLDLDDERSDGSLQQQLPDRYVRGASNNYTRGGKQLGLLASVVWIPEDWMRFYFQYSHAFVTGGPFADEVSGLSSSNPDAADVTIMASTSSAPVRRSTSSSLSAPLPGKEGRPPRPDVRRGGFLFPRPGRPAADGARRRARRR